MNILHLNKSGRNCLIVCATISCIFFQLIFCGLIYLLVALMEAFMSGRGYAFASPEFLLYVGELIEDAEESVAVLGLLGTLSLVLHLGVICFLALRQSPAEAAQKEAPTLGADAKQPT